MLEMLDNNEFYCEISGNNDKNNLKSETIIKDHKAPSKLTTKEVDFLTDFDLGKVSL